MEKERDLTGNIRLLLPEHRQFYLLTFKRLDEEKGLQFTPEGHTAGNLCTGLLADSEIGISNKERIMNVKKYLKYIAKNKGNFVVEFIVNELNFPLPEGTIIDEYLVREKKS